MGDSQTDKSSTKISEQLTFGGSAADSVHVASAMSMPQQPGEVADIAAAHGRMLSVLMDTTSDFIYFKDLKSRLLLVSRSLAARYGLNDPEEAVGKTDFDFYSKESAQPAYEDEQRVMRTGEKIVNTVAKEVWPDGRVTWLSNTKIPLFNESRTVIGMFGVSRDITREKEAEENLQRQQALLEELVEARTKELSKANTRLEQEMADRARAEDALLASERMATIRSMAGGVAMHFNNITGVISSYASSIASRFTPRSRVHDDAMHILEASRRAGELTRQLMNMSESTTPPEVSAREPVALNAVIREASGFLSEMFRDLNVEVKVAKPERMPMVVADRVNLIDTIMSLLMNAAEEMAGGGLIRIDASQRSVRKPGHRNPDAEGGDFVILRIRDSGPGISPELQEEIFKPFFTTKKSPRSFGLGLTYCRNAVMLMGGWVTVRSKPNKGTSFMVYLPKAESAESEDVHVAVSQVSRTILVIDDDVQALDMMKDALEKTEHTVFTADSSDAALSLFEKHFKTIDLTVIDARMDGNALSLIKRFRKLEPQANLVLTSGFSRDFVRGVIPLGPWEFLQKPFDADQLNSSIGKALGIRVQG